MAAMMNVPEIAAKGEIVEVKLLVQHPMETGFAVGRDGKPIPRNIIHRVRCLYLGAQVFEAELFPAVAANPYLAFPLRAEASGEVRLVWTDEAGDEFSEVRTLIVA
jgi:sulfur-oxidizing protein SoxZ